MATALSVAGLSPGLARPPVAAAVSRIYGYTVTDLGAYSTTAGGGSEAWDVNDNGEVVGVSWESGGANKVAFTWSGGTMTAVTPLAGDTNAEARGVNNAGEVVRSEQTGRRDPEREALPRAEHEQHPPIRDHGILDRREIEGQRQPRPRRGRQQDAAGGHQQFAGEHGQPRAECGLPRVDQRPPVERDQLLVGGEERDHPRVGRQGNDPLAPESRARLVRGGLVGGSLVGSRKIGRSVARRMGAPPHSPTLGWKARPRIGGRTYPGTACSSVYAE